jgi:rSAM/selenodomain-associated transferase 2
MNNKLEESSLHLVAVVATLHDDAALAELLPQLARLSLPPNEVIVVDGAGSDATAAICRNSSCTWLPAPAGRGIQLATGAMATHATRSKTDILWFLHADCQPHPEAARAIREAVRNGAVGGYFRFRFGGERSLLKQFLERCIAWRCRVGMVYGDQGLFMTRTAYDSGPGFRAQPLFEEVGLVRALKRTGRFVALKLPIMVSPRRWERDGFLRRTLHNRLLALGCALGIDSAILARWYGGGREH